MRVQAGRDGAGTHRPRFARPDGAWPVHGGRGAPRTDGVRALPGPGRTARPAPAQPLPGDVRRAGAHRTPASAAGGPHGCRAGVHRYTAGAVRAWTPYRALKYFASGWWITMASVDCSG
ncbi:hypothetical protein MBT84_33875 [Streptomyces sp. MBT84]|nr:hypothetical protein [Streptomyces sp. MBT84]